MDDSSNSKNRQQIPPQPQPQFQQFPQPQQPQFQQPQPQQQFPQQPVMGTPYQMPPKKKMSKGALWGIIGGIIGLTITIVGVVLAVILLSGPSKEDYKDLLSQFTSIDLKSSFVSDNSKKNIKAETDKMVGKVDDLNKKMSSHRALKDKEVKEAYDKYIDSWNNGAKEYIEFVGAYTEYNFSKTCSLPSGLSGYIREAKDEVAEYYDSKMKDCMDYLDKMSKSDNKTVSEYGKNLKKYYTEIRQYILDAVKYIKNNREGTPPKAPKHPQKITKEEVLNKWKESGEKFKKTLEDKVNS